MIARVMSDRQPIALVGHDGLELGAGQGNLPVYHLRIQCVIKNMNDEYNFELDEEDQGILDQAVFKNLN